MEEVINKIKVLRGVKTAALVSDGNNQAIRIHTHKLVMPCEGRNIVVPEMVFDIVLGQNSVYGAIKFMGKEPHPIIGPSGIPSWGTASIHIGDAYRMGDYHGMVFLILGCLSQDPASAYAKPEPFEDAKRLAPGWIVA